MTMLTTTSEPLDSTVAKVVTEQAERVCPKCGEWRPINKFRRRRRGSEEGRHFDECNDCRNAYERRRRVKKRRVTFEKFATTIIQAKRDARKIAGLIREMAFRFKGLQNLAAEWKRQIDFACERRRGVSTTLKHFAAIAHIIQVHSELLVASEQDPHEMSDLELDAELAANLQDLIAQQPELAIEVARRLGWTVIPPHATPA
jgi:hypothetical protein